MARKGNKTVEQVTFGLRLLYFNCIRKHLQLRNYFQGRDRSQVRGGVKEHIFTGVRPFIKKPQGKGGDCDKTMQEAKLLLEVV